MSETDTDIKTIVRTAILENEKIRKQRIRTQERGVWQWIATVVFILIVSLLVALSMSLVNTNYLAAGMISAGQYVIGLAILSVAIVFVFIAFGVGCLLLDIGDNLRAINKTMKSVTEKDEYGVADLINE
jgi:uncharacterized membrane protein